MCYVVKVLYEYAGVGLQVRFFIGCERPRAQEKMRETCRKLLHCAGSCPDSEANMFTRAFVVFILWVKAWHFSISKIGSTQTSVLSIVFKSLGRRSSPHFLYSALLILSDKAVLKSEE